VIKKQFRITKKTKATPQKLKKYLHRLGVTVSQYMAWCGCGTNHGILCLYKKNAERFNFRQWCDFIDEQASRMKEL